MGCAEADDVGGVKHRPRPADKTSGATASSMLSRAAPAWVSSGRPHRRRPAGVVVPVIVHPNRLAATRLGPTEGAAAHVVDMALQHDAVVVRIDVLDLADDDRGTG